MNQDIIKKQLANLHKDIKTNNTERTIINSIQNIYEQGVGGGNSEYNKEGFVRRTIDIVVRSEDITDDMLSISDVFINKPYIGELLSPHNDIFNIDLENGTVNINKYKDINFRVVAIEGNVKFLLFGFYIVDVNVCDVLQNIIFYKTITNNNNIIADELAICYLSSDVNYFIIDEQNLSIHLNKEVIDNIINDEINFNNLLTEYNDIPYALNTLWNWKDIYNDKKYIISGIAYKSMLQLIDGNSTHYMKLTKNTTIKFSLLWNTFYGTSCNVNFNRVIINESNSDIVIDITISPKANEFKYAINNGIMNTNILSNSYESNLYRQVASITIPSNKYCILNITSGCFVSNDNGLASNTYGRIALVNYNIYDQ